MKNENFNIYVEHIIIYRRGIWSLTTRLVTFVSLLLCFLLSAVVPSSISGMERDGTRVLDWIGSMSRRARVQNHLLAGESNPALPRSIDWGFRLWQAGINAVLSTAILTDILARTLDLFASDFEKIWNFFYRWKNTEEFKAEGYRYSCVFHKTVISSFSAECLLEQPNEFYQLASAIVYSRLLDWRRLPPKRYSSGLWSLVCISMHLWPKMIH